MIIKVLLEKVFCALQNLLQEGSYFLGIAMQTNLKEVQVNSYYLFNENLYMMHYLPDPKAGGGRV